MSVFSLEYLLLVTIGSFFSWIFTKKTRKYWIFLVNGIYLYFLKDNLITVMYAVSLTVYTCLFGLLIYKRKKKWITLVASILIVLGLAFFKYASFLSFSSSIIMPLGISFYSFKAISYLVDIYEGKVASKNFIEVFDYVLFFPCFLAGPIHRSSEFFYELEQEFTFVYKDQKNGFIQMMLGLFQKLVIADELHAVMNIFYHNDAFTGWYKILAIVLYSFYIYVDFDAYSNISIGIARMLGFHLDRNFHTPYLASSIQEFWDRWHISLSSWLKDYIYIPLGGSRKGSVRKYLNVFIVFLVSGLWHGSTLMFVIWGIGHGVLNIIEDALKKLLPIKKNFILSGIGILLNFVFVSILWVFFYETSISDAVSIFKSALDLSQPFSYMTVQEAITFNEWIWMFVLLGIVIITDILRNKWDMVEGLSNRIFIIRWAFYIILIFITIIFGVYGPGYNAQDFIYVTF